MTTTTAHSRNLPPSTPDPTQAALNRLVTLVVPTLIVLLAVAAGGLHLVHNFLPMLMAPMGGGGAPAGGGFPDGGPPGGSFPLGGPPGGGFPDGGPAGGGPGGSR